MKHVLLAIVLAVILKVHGRPDHNEDYYANTENADEPDYGVDYDAEDEENPKSPSFDNGRLPEITSHRQDELINPGENVTLHCNVSDLGGSVILWKQNSNLIYQGSTRLSNDNLNIHVDNDGQTFKIINATTRNSGNFECAIMLTENQQLNLSHTVAVRVDPVITSFTAENNVTAFNIGETISMTCIATGVPRPVISWHLKERLPMTGERLVIESAKMKDAGTYRCLADNGSKKPAHGSVDIYVRHKPVISIDKYIVNTNENMNVELKCQVHGYPAPVVVWQKEGHNIVTSGNLKVESKEHSSILIITDVADRDFATYTCSAKNSLGKVEKSVKVVRTPAVVHIHSKKTGRDFEITFKVQSVSPITEHELEYRRKGESNWSSVKPEVSSADTDNVYTIQYVLKNLESGTWETRARSLNNHGWSEYSDIHEFTTAKHHNNKHKNKPHKEKEVKVAPPVYVPKDDQMEVPMEVHEPNTPPAQHQETMHKETSVGASQTGGSSTVTSSFLVLSIALLYLW